MPVNQVAGKGAGAGADKIIGNFTLSLHEWHMASIATPAFAQLCLPR